MYGLDGTNLDSTGIGLLGRELEFRFLRRTLRPQDHSTTPVVAVYGNRGIGKSTLITAVVRACFAPHRTRWIDFAQPGRRREQALAALDPDVEVVVLDGVQEARPAELDRFVDAAIQRPETRFIVAFDSLSIVAGDPIGPRLAAVAAHRGCESIQLGGLPRDALARLLDAATGATLPGQALDLICGCSSGHPSAALAIMRQLSVERHSSMAALTERIAELACEPLHDAAPAVTLAVRALALLGRQGELATLAVTTGLGEQELLSALESARAHGLVDVDGSESAYRIAHPAIARHLVTSLSARESRELSRRIALALADRAGSWQSEPNPTFEPHRNGVHRGLTAVLETAERAHTRWSPDEELRTLRLALDLVEVDRQPGERTENERAELLARVAIALADAALHREAEAALTVALAGLRGCGVRAQRLADLVARVGAMLMLSGGAPPSEAARSVLSELTPGDSVTETDGVEQDSLEPDDSAPENLALRQRLRLQLDPDELVSSGPLSAWRQRSGDAQALATAWTAGIDLDRALVMTRDPRVWSEPEIHREYERALGLIDPRARMLALIAVAGQASGGSCSIGLSEQVIDSAGALAARLECGWVSELVWVQQGLRLMEVGRLRAGLRAVERARDEAARRPATRWSGRPSLALWLIAQHLAPNWPAIASQAWAAACMVEPVLIDAPALAALSVLAEARSGRGDAARTKLGPLLKLLELLAAADDGRSAAAALGITAEAIVVLGDAEAARSFEPTLEALLDRGLGWSAGSHPELARARIAATYGDRTAALHAYGAAITSLGDAGRRPLLAIAEFESAMLDGSAGASHRRAFERLGMDAWSARVPSVVAAIETLTHRELEVLGMVAHGMTSREIAGQLVLSVHTVERHVSNCYRKLGVRNRVAATRIAFEAGVIGEAD